MVHAFNRDQVASVLQRCLDVDPQRRAPVRAFRDAPAIDVGDKLVVTGNHQIGARHGSGDLECLGEPRPIPGLLLERGPDAARAELEFRRLVTGESHQCALEFGDHGGIGRHQVEKTKVDRAFTAEFCDCASRCRTNFLQRPAVGHQPLGAGSDDFGVLRREQ